MLKNLISDRKVAICNKILNSLSKLMPNTKYLEDLHWLAILQLLIHILFWVQALVAKSGTKVSVLISLSCGILVHNVGKSYVELLFDC